jgi:hypothetical protein
MRTSLRVVVRALLAIPLFSTADAVAQQPAPLEAIQVFLDCQGFFCDFDHFRREMAFVNWVRDRQDAHVHLLGTSQPTGGGGREFTFAFLGLREFVGRSDTLRYVSRNTDTQTEVRDGQVRIIKLGLMRYVAQTQAGERVQITFETPTETAAVGPVRDPWNLWVFTARLGGNFDGESQQQSRSINGSISAIRTAPDVKLEFRLFGNFNRSEQELTDTTYVNTSRSMEAEQLVVWSLDDHWSLGFRSSATVSTFFNHDLALRGGPALEFNIYPYDQSTRRQFTILYGPEIATFDYEEVTIFDQTSETLPLHRLDLGLTVRQPWGSISTSAGALQFLHDLSKHRLNLFGSVNVRIVRGLDFRIGGSVARIKDQLYLPKGGLTDEEILVRRRQLGTSFRYFTFMNLSFRFGSRFANVVNPRMGGGGGEFFFFN